MSLTKQLDSSYSVIVYDGLGASETLGYNLRFVHQLQEIYHARFRETSIPELPIKY